MYHKLYIMDNKFRILEVKLRKQLELLGTVSKNGNLITYRSIQYNGQLGDFGTEYWTDSDWENHRLSVEKMKADGTYMEPYISEITLIHDPRFDEQPKREPCGVESHRMVILDFSKK